MIDIKEIRRDPKTIEEKLATKTPTSLKKILELDEAIRSLKNESEELKAKRNSASKEIGKKKRSGADVSGVMKEVDGLHERISASDHSLKELEERLTFELAHLPNLPMDDIPVASDKEGNVCLKEVGIKPTFSFPFKHHLELNERLHLFDFTRSAKISGAGWPLYTDKGARLEWALINYMLDIHRKNGFVQIMPPLLAKPEALFDSAHLPKFEDQLFKLRDEDFHLYLIPTAEAVLNGMHGDEILDESLLPIKYTAYTPCFRREAGAAGAGERGLIRMHQFNKVELFCFTKPEESRQIFEEMLKSAEEVLQGLGLHYRNMLLSTGDMSFAAAKTIDIEVWLPGQNRYYEVSSVSNCTDFQARRSKTRFRRKNEKPEFVYTLNGSGVATSRLLVALLENNQQSDGSVKIPPSLHPYLKGISHL